MKLVADAHGRLCARELFPPSTAFNATRQPDGSIRLIELVEKRPPAARLVKEGGRTCLTSDRTVTLEDTQRALEEFP